MNSAGKIQFAQVEKFRTADIAAAKAEISSAGTQVDQYQTIDEIEPWIVAATAAPQFQLKPRNIDRCNTAHAMSLVSLSLQIILLSEYKNTKDDAFVEEFLRRFTFAENITIAFSLLDSYLAFPPQPFLTTFLRMHGYTFLPGIGPILASFNARELCLPPKSYKKRNKASPSRPSDNRQNLNQRSALPAAIAATEIAVVGAVLASKLAAAASCGAVAGPAGALACAVVMP